MKIRKIYFILLIGLFLQSCVNEGIETNQKEDINKITINYKTFNDIKENTYLREKLDLIHNHFDVNQGNNKSDNNGYNLVIKTDEILETITNNVYSYTFRLEEVLDPLSTFENLVIKQEEENGDFYFYIYKYTRDSNIEGFPYRIQRINLTEDQITSNNLDLLLPSVPPNECCVWIVSPRDFEPYLYCLEGCSSSDSSNNSDSNNSGNNSGSNNSGNESGSSSSNSSGSSNNSGSTSGDSSNGSSSNSTNQGGHLTSGGNNGGGSYTGGGESTPNFHNGIAGVLTDTAQITDEIENCLQNSTVNISSFVYNNYNYAVQINNYLKSNSCSNESQSLALEFLKIIESVPNAKFIRYKELNEILQNNPWALIQNCAEQNGLDTSNYLDLYNHTLPQACIERLNALGSDFKDQPLSEGNAAVANVDYYGVEITTNPDFDNDGYPDTEVEVYEKYRQDFGELASGSQEDFQFSCDNPIGDNFTTVGWDFYPYFSYDSTQWNSSNPVTTIFKIDAWAFDFLFDMVADDGAIMISEYTPNYWIGSTIQTEFSQTQPFSGNRQWGWLINQNGNLELFARAVDVARVSSVIDHLPPYLNNNECQEDTYYNIGEVTWSNLQEQIKNWVIENGGQATVIPKTAVRFSKEKLKELLESNETIDQILCD
jgi:hypothetical protein